jgi:hypothetical protein
MPAVRDFPFSNVNDICQGHSKSTLSKFKAVLEMGQLTFQYYHYTTAAANGFLAPRTQAASVHLCHGDESVNIRLCDIYDYRADALTSIRDTDDDDSYLHRQVVK